MAFSVTVGDDNRVLLLGKEEEEEGTKDFTLEFTLDPPVIGSTCFASLKISTKLESSWTLVKSTVLFCIDSV